jgi:hypothetical protein
MNERHEIYRIKYTNPTERSGVVGLPLLPFVSGLNRGIHAEPVEAG